MLTRTMTIIFVNGYGILLSAYCCVAFISLSAPEVQSTYIRNVSIVLFVGLACLVASYYDHVTFTPIVGYYASFLSVSVFAAPLAEIMQVFRTRSVETISFNIAVVSMLSCTFWCLFGVLISDNNVWRARRALVSLLTLRTHFLFLLTHARARMNIGVDTKLFGRIAESMSAVVVRSVSRSHSEANVAKVIKDSNKM
jgi:uncharacterized protein with PQ loop repeat